MSRVRFVFDTLSLFEDEEAGKISVKVTDPDQRVLVENLGRYDGTSGRNAT
jgi:hypothetical protein